MLADVQTLMGPRACEDMYDVVGGTVRAFPAGIANADVG